MSRLTRKEFSPLRALRRSIRARTADFAREEDGALIIFAIFMFGLMLAIGGLSFDIMRYEAHRERLQSTLDRAVLAAASLTQTLPAQQVVEEYFAKAGMSDFLDEVIVTEGLNARKVEARASIHVPLHHGAFAMWGGNGENGQVLIAAGTSVAEESIGDVEISLVLDVSGSMNSYNRLTNLQDAAVDFVDAVHNASASGTVHTSIIPYATQVNAGELLLSYFNPTDTAHDRSFCINFAGADFNTTTISTTDPLQQTLHFDPWLDENDTWWDLGEYDSFNNPVCPVEVSRQILPWSTDVQELTDYINALTAKGNTSTDIGVKWGAFLLDPSARTILADMISNHGYDSDLAGRPFDYDKNDAMKILVVMTDGNHTNQYYMGDYRSGNSFVWKYVDASGIPHYSVWWDGNNSTAIINPSGNYTYCDQWNHGTCEDWDYGSNPEFWYHGWSPDKITNYYEWRSTPYGGSDAVRMTWDEVWAEIPPEFFSDDFLYRMKRFTHNYRNSFEWAIDYINQSTKDSRLSSICEEVKDQDVIIFAIGLEVSSHSGTLMQNCASSPAHYYDVDNLDISSAFESIAAQINQLRLIQ